VLRANKDMLVRLCLQFGSQEQNNTTMEHADFLRGDKGQVNRYFTLQIFM